MSEFNRFLPDKEEFDRSIPNENSDRWNRWDKFIGEIALAEINKNRESVAPENLRYVAQSNQLRNDQLATTYVNENNEIFLKPSHRTNLAIVDLLHNLHLSSGEVVTDIHTHQPAYVSYRDADLVPLAAVLNASISVPDAYSDMVDSLKAVGKSLRSMEAKLGFVTDSSEIDSWAIDRNTGLAEPLIPINVRPSENARTVLKGLVNAILSKSITESERGIMLDASQEALGSIFQPENKPETGEANNGQEA